MTLHSILYNDSYAFLGLATPGYRLFANDSESLALKISNSDVPQLRTADSDVPRLRALADLYHFSIILDETVGHHLNVQVLTLLSAASERYSVDWAMSRRVVSVL